MNSTFFYFFDGVGSIIALAFLVAGLHLQKD